MTQEKPVAFHDLPASVLPFTIELSDAGTGHVLWSAIVREAGALHVPSRKELKVPASTLMRARFTFGDGDEHVYLLHPAFGTMRI